MDPNQDNTGQSGGQTWDQPTTPTSDVPSAPPADQPAPEPSPAPQPESQPTPSPESTPAPETGVGQDQGVGGESTGGSAV